MPTSRKDSGPRAARAAFAAALAIVVAFPMGQAAAQQGSDENKPYVREHRMPSTARAPRPVRMGGTRSAAPRKIQRLGGAKIPFAKHRNLLPSKKLDLGGVRSAGPRPISGLPRNNPPDLLPAPVPDRAGRGVASPAPVAVERLIAARLVDRMNIGGGLDIDGSRRAFTESLRQHGIEGVEVGPRIRVPSGAGGVEPNAAAERARMLREIDERLAGNPSLAEAVRRRIAEQTPPTDMAEAVRREMTERGYAEVELAPGEYGFVRGADPDVLRQIVEHAGGIRSVADQIEQQAPLLRGRRPMDYVREWDDLCRDRNVTDETVRGFDPFVHRPRPPEPEFVELTSLESAAAAWAEGEFDLAAASLRSYLDGTPEDTEVRRLLGVTLLLAGQTREGVEALGIAYETDPNLAARPLDAESFRAHRTALRRAVADAVALGHRTREHRAWLAASVLMHAEGRVVLAERMLTRAAECGLPDEIEAEMRLALGS